MLFNFTTGPIALLITAELWSLRAMRLIIMGAIYVILCVSLMNRVQLAQ